MFLAAFFLIASVEQTPTKAAFRRGIAENAAFRRQQFIAAGLTPIEEAARSGRNVRRLQVSVWLPGRPPTLEIERHRDDRVTLLLTWNDRPAERHVISASIWREITALDAAVYAPETYDPKRIGQVPNGVASCHGDRASFEASIDGQVRTAGAGQCFPRLESFNPAKLAVIRLLTQAAVKTRKDCVFDETRSADSFVQCFR